LVSNIDWILSCYSHVHSPWFLTHTS
jgi:hypothetical protein